MEAEQHPLQARVQLLRSLAKLHYRAGRAASAVELQRSAQALNLELHDQEVAEGIAIELAASLTEAGDAAAAVVLLEQTLADRLAQPGSDGLIAAYIRARLADALLSLPNGSSQEHRRARQQAAEGLASLEALAAPPELLAEVTLIAAQASWRTGHEDEAERMLAKARRLASTAPIPEELRSQIEKWCQIVGL